MPTTYPGITHFLYDLFLEHVFSTLPNSLWSHTNRRGETQTIPGDPAIFDGASLPVGILVLSFRPYVCHELWLYGMGCCVNMSQTFSNFSRVYSLADFLV